MTAGDPLAAAREIWFEALLDRDLALLFARVQNVHSRIGKAKRAALLARLAAAIPESASGTVTFRA